MGGRGSCRRHMSLRCSVCYEKGFRGYTMGYHGRTWENIIVIRETNSGFVCKCRTCGHEYKSNSSAARRAFRG